VSTLPVIGKTVVDVAFFNDNETPWEVAIKFSDGSCAYIAGNDDGTADLLFTRTGEGWDCSYRIRREII